MSEKRLNKSLVRYDDLDSHLPCSNRTAVVVSDSKGSYLRRCIRSRIERSIVWLGEAGLKSKGGIDLLKANLNELKSKYGLLSVYIFLGTCDLTTKTGDFITLNDSHESDSAHLIHRYEQLVSFAQEKNFEITFLEIPIYSIKEWNRYHGDPCPELFRDQDNKLHNSLKIINDEIERINFTLGKQSPKFSLDLERSRKPSGKSERKYYNFLLLKDGIHPNPLLSRLWLRRIVALIRQECY
ncbi:MAG: hypothetical protein AB2693_17390 [Candidatus Thiodiazotropha sp.]